MASEIKVAIAYPSGEFVNYRFVKVLLNLIMHSYSFVRMGVLNEVSSRVAFNRNRLVEEARKTGATHILFIDTDTLAPADGLMTLLSYGKDIMCATTCKRNGVDNDAIGIAVDPTENITSSKLVQLASVGLPFMLIDMKIFDKLSKPYFAEPGDDKGELIPEDNYFCAKVRDAGYEIWCDMELSSKIKHLGMKEYQMAEANFDVVETGNLKVA